MVVSYHSAGIYISGRVIIGDYNEVLQFIIIIIGLLPLVFLSLMDVGGWGGLKEGLEPIAAAGGYAPDAWTTTWKYTQIFIRIYGSGMFGILFGLVSSFRSAMV